MQEQLPNNKQRTQSDIDAAIMLASFTVHVDEDPLSTENGREQSPADERTTSAAADERTTSEKHIISRQLHPHFEKFPTMVRIMQLTTHNNAKLLLRTKRTI